jgi:hypothetical protein
VVDYNKQLTSWEFFGDETLFPFLFKILDSPLLINVFRTREDMKIKIPNACSQVQTFLKSTKEMNNVVAFLAVEVIDIVRAPYSRVIKAEQDDPKKPAVQNSINTNIFLQKVQMECPPTPSSISS